MKDEVQERAKTLFTDLLKSDSPTVLAGRYAADADKEEFVWQDILTKLDCSKLAPGARVLDIGCSCGVLAKKWIEHIEAARAELYLNDIPEVIEKVRRELVGKRSHVKLIPGSFPNEIVEDSLPREGFDYIIMYSVAHYTSEPAKLIDAAVGCLKSGGKLLVGDIPNVNKKGRFLASEAGRKFDAAYKKVQVDEIPKYIDHHDFVSQWRGSPPQLNDALLTHLVAKYRYLGWEAYLMPQPKNLPFCFTREDLLLVKND